MIIHLASADNKTGMLDIEDHHDQKHKSSVKDVKIHLGAQKDTFLSTSILGNTENASDDDQETGEVENPKVARPWESRCHSIACRRGLHALVEDAGDGNKDREEYDLQEQASKDDIVAKLDGIWIARTREHTATFKVVSQLEIERQQRRSKLYSPPDCTKKDRTSPATNIFVNREGLIIEWRSPPVSLMIRPSTI
jgi:hypothetical protein